MGVLWDKDLFVFKGWWWLLHCVPDYSIITIMPQTIYHPPANQPTDEEKENPLQLNPQLPSFLPQSNSFPSWIRFRSCYDLFYWKIMRYVVGVAFCLSQSHRVCGCVIRQHSTEREQEENWFNSQQSKPTIESTYPLPKTMTRGQGMDPIQIFKRRKSITTFSPVPALVKMAKGLIVHLIVSQIKLFSSLVFIYNGHPHSRSNVGASKRKGLQLILNWLIKWPSIGSVPSGIPRRPNAIEGGGYCLFRGCCK